MKLAIAVLLVALAGCDVKTNHVVPAGFEGVVIEYYLDTDGAMADTVWVGSEGIACLSHSINPGASVNKFIVADTYVDAGVSQFQVGEVFVGSRNDNIQFMRYIVGHGDASVASHESERLHGAEDVFEEFCGEN